MVNEDIFDVVNERDEIIGREPRRVVHARGLRHRAVHVLVYNVAGQLFLQKRAMTKDNKTAVSHHAPAPLRLTAGTRSAPSSRARRGGHTAPPA